MKNVLRHSAGRCHRAPDCKGDGHNPVSYTHLDVYKRQVYTLIIAAFIPNKQVFGFVGLQGLVMFCLYLSGVISAFIVAFILKRTMTRGASQALIMELPSYKLPNARDFFLGIYIAAKLSLIHI